jgi:hypothetical protein
MEVNAPYWWRKERQDSSALIRTNRRSDPNREVIYSGSTLLASASTVLLPVIGSVPAAHRPVAGAARGSVIMPRTAIAGRE